MSIEYMYLYWIYSVNNWGIYGSLSVSLRPSGAVLGNVNLEEYTFLLDIHSQQLRNRCQLIQNKYTCTPGPDFKVAALRARDWRM